MSPVRWFHSYARKLARWMVEGSTSLPSGAFSRSPVVVSGSDPLAAWPPARLDRLDLCLRAQRLFRLLAIDLDRESLATLQPSSFQGVDRLANERHRRGLAQEREALSFSTATAQIHLCQAAFPSAWDRFSNVDRPHPELGGQTLLSFYVGARNVAMIDLLLDLGANPAALNEDGSSALLLARLKAEAFFGGASALAHVADQAHGILRSLERHELDAIAPPGSDRPRVRL